MSHKSYYLSLQDSLIQAGRTLPAFLEPSELTAVQSRIGTMLNQIARQVEELDSYAAGNTDL